MIEKPVFNVEELSKYLHISQSSIRKLVRERKIPYYRILSRIFFDKETIDEWISNQEFNNLNISIESPPTSITILRWYYNGEK